MAATLKEIAAYAGVSPSTVSRVVRGVPAVSKSAQVRVLRAIDALGYRPNAAARTIRTGVSYAIGYVVPDISNWFYSVVFQGAQSVLRDAGYELVLGTSEGSHELQSHAIDSFIGRNIDGFILSLIDERWDGLPVGLEHVPTVLLDRELEHSAEAGGGPPRGAMVLSDHAAGMRDAVSYLHDLGHRRIALLTGRSDIYSTRTRREAFQQRAKELGLRPEDVLERTGDRSVETGNLHTEALLRLPEPPTAIIAGSNQLLHGALQAFSRLDVRCPQDVSLIACEDSDIARLYRPSVTVVRRDLRRMGEVAAELLLDQLERTDDVIDGTLDQAQGEPEPGKNGALPVNGGGRGASGEAPTGLPRRRVLPTELIVRSSAGPAAASRASTSPTDADALRGAVPEHASPQR